MNLDHLVFGFHLLIVATVGILASCRKQEADNDFLASHTLRWWIIAGPMSAPARPAAGRALLWDWLRRIQLLPSAVLIDHSAGAHNSRINWSF